MQKIHLIVGVLAITGLSITGCSSAGSAGTTQQVRVSQGRGQTQTVTTAAPAGAAAEQPYALAGPTDKRVRMVMRPGIRGEATPTPVIEGR